MDVRHQISSPDALARTSCDALLLIVVGDAVDAALDAPLAAALRDALAHDDLVLKAGKALYLHRPAGVRASRVVFAAAGAAASAKAFKAAVASGLQQLKGKGALHVAVGFAGGGGLTDAHAEAAVAALQDATYPATNDHAGQTVRRADCGDDVTRTSFG